MIKNIFRILLLLTMGLFLGFKPQSRYKLLFYITTDKDEIELYYKDTDSIPDICVKTHIDTIDFKDVIKCKNTDVYRYNGYTFYKSQFFNLRDYYKLKKFKVYFGIRNGFIDGHVLKGNCTGDKRSRFIMKKTQEHVKKGIEKRGLFWIDGDAYYNGKQYPLNRVRVIVYPSE